MDTAIDTQYDGETGTLYFTNDGDEYSCHFTIESGDVLFHANQDSFESFDEFRADIEANFDADITSRLF